MLELCSGEVIERYLAEKGTGSNTADLLITVAADRWQDFKARGAIVEYASPESSHYPEWSLLHAGLYTVGAAPVLLDWNKAVLPAALVPTGIADLVQTVSQNPHTST